MIGSKLGGKPEIKKSTLCFFFHVHLALIASNLIILLFIDLFN